MSQSKFLSEDQIATLQSWADAGDGLSDIQRKLAVEMEIKVTYLETRFLLDDLDVALKSEPKPESESEPEPEPAREGEQKTDPAPGRPAPGDGTGGESVSGGKTPDSPAAEVSVTVDQVQRPGAILSGSASFGDSGSMKWWLDQMGQLGVDPGESGFRPGPEQMMAFQRELQSVIQKSGF